MSRPLPATLTRRLFAALCLLAAPAAAFDFSRELFGAPPTLGLGPPLVDPATGAVWLNGGDGGEVVLPFAVDWGDGGVPESLWFPFEHVYSDLLRNYVVTVTSHYPAGATDVARTVVRFVPVAVAPVALPPELAVTIPDHDVALGTHFYPPPEDLSHFDGSFFGTVPRDVIEQVMTAATVVQDDAAGGDLFLVDGAFRQVVLRNPEAGGMYSLWFTSPVAFASGDWGFQGEIQYSSFFHEMGHNVSLNSPAVYHYGGRIDGSANAIFSETMAQVFAHTAAYELLNRPADFGIPAELAIDIERSARASMAGLRATFDAYIAEGMPYSSWNDPATPEDETFGTFMTLAYTFARHAELAGGYLPRLRRMMSLLRGFDASWEAAYDRDHDSAAGDAFRATLMVAALSHAFGTDLRGELAALGFPIDDAWYEALTGGAGSCAPSAATACLLGDRFRVEVAWATATAAGDGQVMQFGAERAESDQSAFFWFFHPANFEIGVKMVDACVEPFDAFWVFVSGFTNQAFTLTVTDTATGRTRVYSNPLGQYPQTIGATSSTTGFPCAP